MKSKYCTSSAETVFQDLIGSINARYILFSYNNMSNKGNNRSNAKISDKAIFEILGKKGKVKVFEERSKAFSARNPLSTRDVKSHHHANVVFIGICGFCQKLK